MSKAVDLFTAFVLLRWASDSLAIPNRGDSSLRGCVQCHQVVCGVLMHSGEKDFTGVVFSSFLKHEVAHVELYPGLNAYI